MQRQTRLVLAMAAPFALVGAGAANAAILSDDFDGDALDSALWSASTSNRSVGGGSLEVVAPDNAWEGTSIVSKASDLNFYDQPLTFEISGLDFGGMGIGQNGRAMGYLAIGTADPDQSWAYRPAASYEDGIVLAVTNPSGNTAAYSLRINLYNSEGQTTSVDYGLNALPTAMSLTLDGTAGTYVLELEGAAFGWGGDEDDTTRRTAALPTEWSESTFGVTRMAFGAYNNDTISETATMTVGSASVSVVPEPASLALLGGAGVVLAARRRR